MSSGAATPESDHDSGSDSSTIVFDHECFQTFKARVLELCKTKLQLPRGDVSIERKPGGGFNRIIGISVIDNETYKVHEYILRIPRFESAQMDRDMAPLRLLHERSKIKIPHVISFDSTSQNPLESPYMLQTLIPGSPIFPIYPDLPHEMKCAIAKELGECFAKMHAIRSSMAGRLTSLTTHYSLMVQPFDAPWPDSAVPYQDGQLPAQATLNLLHELFRTKKEAAVAAGPNQIHRVEFFESFIAMASEMSALGVFDENYYCLCHLDLDPRNILVDSPATDLPHAITGILNWDSAIFAPPMMSCTPPVWLWAWNEDGEEDERLANEPPPTPEARETKQCFEDAAGTVYLQYAYGAKFRLARQLIRFAIDGIQSNEDFMSAETLVSEWNEFKTSQRVDAAS